jgi:drug/metabolite transporter (DMT)-like permease
MGKEGSAMRYKLWWIQALLGVVLIVAPFVGRFSSIHPASYTDVIVGVLLVVLAIASMQILGETDSEMHASRAWRAKP